MNESTTNLNRSILRHLKGILTAFDRWYEENEINDNKNKPLISQDIVFMIYKLVGNKLESIDRYKK